MLQVLVNVLRLIFSLYFILTSVCLCCLSLIVVGVVALPFGYRRVSYCLSGIANFWFNSFIAWTHYISPSDFVVSVDSEGLQKSGPNDTLSHISIAFGIGTLTSKSKTDESNSISNDIVISNHQIYPDWIYIWAFLNHIDRSGYLRIVLKRSLQFVPLIGQGMKMLGFIFLHRSWEKDKVKFDRRVRRIGSNGLSYNLLIFPEGTTLTDHARLKGQAYAKEHGLPVLKNVLLPRSTGMFHALKALSTGDGEEGVVGEGSVHGILDLTFGYTGLNPSVIPEKHFTLRGVFMDSKAPPQIHVNASYIPLADIPLQDKDQFTRWLAGRFERKDRLLDQFYEAGHFGGITAQPMPLTKPFSYLCFWTMLSAIHLPIVIFIIWRIFS